MRTRAFLRLHTTSLLLAGAFSLSTGCVITIGDDVSDDGDDDYGDSSSSSSDDGDGDSSSSSSSDDGDSSSSSDDGDSSSSSDDGDSSSSSSDDGDSSSSSDDGDSSSSSDDGDSTTGDGDCDPMDAMNGPEECYDPSGWFWNGSQCEQITCTCYGSECDQLFASKSDCQAAYDQCDMVADVCDPQDAEGIGDCDAFFGYAWTGFTCKNISGCECVGSDCDELVWDQNECWDAHALCELPAPECTPDDAKGEGLCEIFLGWAWDGAQCEPLSGCECIGTDCDSLPQELWECQTEHAGCELPPPPPECSAMDAKGVGLCALFLGYRWNGMACEGVSGCSCDGSDCDALYQELDECQAANLGCI